ncbi:MAG TPA: PDZ domain-containing protein, partial [Anaerolineae bacterium]|nr:PDZ domain-containing protein [Anaerolineae bacterium]
MPTIHYALSMPHPQTHLYHVEVAVEGFDQTSYDLIMPSWTPGSYLIREFARHVQEFQALDAASQQPLPWSKRSKNTWRVDAPAGHGTILLRYNVYANELTVRTSHLDTSHGYFNGANLFVYLDGQRRHPVTLSVTVPYADWKVSTGLPRASISLGGGNGAGNGRQEPEHDPLPRYHFQAEDYDHLIDCPVECSNHRLLSFEVDDVQHQIALWGHGNEDPERLRRDTQAVVQAARDIFGGLPYDYYLFILHLLERGSGGLEHRNSSSNAVPRWSFRKPADYEKVISLLAHEFFHVWNVKRIEPASFRDFEYRWETYTRLLWVMEGFTTYYTPLLLRRAGLITPERTLESFGEQILKLLQTPGRHLQSAETASFDAWIKLYRPDENTPNTSVSYYLKGSLIALLLDLEIRSGEREAGSGRGEAGNHLRSLDDVLITTYRDYTLQSKGIPEDKFQSICEQVAGGSLQQFFDDYVRGVAELPFEEYLGRAGLAVTYSWKGEGGERSAGLGVQVKQQNGRAVVETVFADGPAYHADLSVGDEIIALDGYRVNQETLGERLADRQPGDQVTLTLFRRDELREVALTLGQRPYNKVEIRPRP